MDRRARIQRLTIGQIEYIRNCFVNIVYICFYVANEGGGGKVVHIVKEGKWGMKIRR